MSHISSHPHEVEGHLKFTPGEHETYDGLDPCWFLSLLLFREFDGYSRKIETEIEGELWEVEMSYWKTGIAPRSSDPIEGDRLYGFQLRGSGPGESKATFQCEPRFEGMQHYEGGDLSVPWQLGGEGIDTDFHGSNIEPDRYPPLLRAFVDALASEAGTNVRSSRYFGEPHPSSNIYTYERYVRLRREYGEKLVNTTGTFWSIFQLLASEIGSKWEFQGDNEEVIGKMHRLRLYPESASELIPTHSLGKQLKHYFMKHAKAQTGPTAHPKFGVLITKSLNGGEAVAWNERTEVEREIEETIINALGWAGVSTKPDSQVFVEDKHFAVRESEVDISRFDDPTPEIEAQQEALIVTTMRELSDGAEELAYDLAESGGKRYDEAAKDLEVSTSSIYRWLTELGQLVANDNGELRLRSRKFEQEIRSIAEQAERAVRTGADRIAKLVNMDQRESEDNALQEWLNKWVVEVVRLTGSDEKCLRFDTVLSELRSSQNPRVTEVLREGYDAWAKAGRDPKVYLGLWFEADVDGQHHRSKVRRQLPKSLR